MHVCEGGAVLAGSWLVALGPMAHGLVDGTRRWARGGGSECNAKKQEAHFASACCCNRN